MLDTMTDAAVIILRKRKALPTCAGTAKESSSKLLRSDSCVYIHDNQSPSGLLEQGSHASAMAHDVAADTLSTVTDSDFEFCNSSSSKDTLCAGKEEVDALAEVPNIDSSRYIKGTRLLVDGWFQACRGCNDLTSSTTVIQDRDVHMCRRCQTKYGRMSDGEYPPNIPPGAHELEPLYFWVPRLVPAMQPMSCEQRRSFCDALIINQDEAWQAVIRQS